MRFLGYIFLPITKWTLLGTKDREVTRRLFGFSEWLESKKKPLDLDENAIDRLENRFDGIFQKKTMDIIDFKLFRLYAQEELQLDEDLNPFDKGLFHMTDYELVFIKLLKMGIAQELPVTINGYTIFSSIDDIRPRVVTLDTLNQIDLESTKKSVDMTDLPEREWALDELFEKLEEAKEKECDFFTSVG